MENNKLNINLGCGSFLVPVTFIVLLISKLIYSVNISWWVVFCPLIGYAVLIILFLILGITAIIWKS